jgi:hypothetical protein
MPTDDARRGPEPSKEQRVSNPPECWGVLGTRLRFTLPAWPCYPESMATDSIHKPTAEMIHLTGLPEPVVREVERLVYQARAKQADEAAASATRTVGQEMLNGKFPRFVSDPNPSTDQFTRLLDEMESSGVGRSLPADFSRADIYDDHD